MAIAGCDKPVIAAIEGHAASAGIGIALLCDRIIASNSSRFTFSFNRVGLGPDWGLSATLPDRVGRAAARKLLWEASKFDAQTALDMGLIDQICLPGGALDTAWMEAKILANKPALSVQHAKRYFSIPLDELCLALENEASNQTACFMSDDFITSLNIFRNRRRSDTSN
jgi:2-(1,2-epoxy-1,2-dihydrophenyl)acetyl-CoA isomerase